MQTPLPVCLLPDHDILHNGSAGCESQLCLTDLMGHLAASGLFPADVEMLNREIGTFIERGQTRVKRAAETPPPFYDSGPLLPPSRGGPRPPRR